VLEQIKPKASKQKVIGAEISKMKKYRKNNRNKLVS
jgi:hypothetical protein